MVLIMIYFICTSNYESSKFQVKDMNVYIEPLIDELLKLWNGITMYDVSRPIRKKEISIPCNGCMDNTRCPWVNFILWFVILSSTLIAFNDMD